MATGKYKEGRAARGSNWTPVGGIAVHGCERAEWATYAWEVDSLPLKVLVRFGVAEKEGEVVLGPADVGQCRVDTWVESMGGGGGELTDPEEPKEGQRKCGREHEAVMPAKGG